MQKRKTFSREFKLEGNGEDTTMKKGRTGQSGIKPR